MELEKILKSFQPKIDEVMNWLEGELRSLNVGKASTTLIEGVAVNYYGSTTPLKGLANISVVDPANLSVQPFDPSSLKEIEKALTTSDLGISATSDGRTIRVGLPPLSEERRQELSRVVKDKTEKARVSIRNSREEVWEDIQEKEKAGELTEDDRYRGQAELNKMVETAGKKIEETEKSKVSEIIKV